MFKITLIATALVLAFTTTQAGFSRGRVGYRAGFASPLPFAADYNFNTPYGSHFEASYDSPLPVAPLSGHHPYAAIGYSAPTVVKFRSSSGGFNCDPLTTYDSGRSHHKFAFPAPVPSVYNAPPPATFTSPPVTYSGFEAPSTIVKFGPPITTTTTTYSTASAVAGFPVANHYNTAAGW